MTDQQSARDGLEYALRSALRFAASRAAITSEEEKGILAAFARTAQPNAAEPVAWLYHDDDDEQPFHLVQMDRAPKNAFPYCTETPLYAHPPAAPSSQDADPFDDCLGVHVEANAKRFQDAAERADVRGLVELREAVAFFDRVKAASEDEKIAVGRDHWDWLERAARKVAALSPTEQSADVRGLVEAAFDAGWDRMLCHRDQGGNLWNLREQLRKEYIAAIFPTGEAQQGGEG